LSEKHEVPEINDSWILNALIENAADGFYVKDQLCRLVKVNRRTAIDSGYTNIDDIVGKTNIELFGEERGSRYQEQDLRVMKTGIPIIGHIDSFVDAAGKTNWTSTTKWPIHDDEGKIVGVLGITREINDLKQIEKNLSEIATHDTLTGLFNRQYFLERLDQAIANAKSTNLWMGLLFVDINGFKKVNDVYGHKKGDELLVEMGQVLLNVVRSSDLVARYGGDEFVILLEGLKSIDNAPMIAAKVSEAADRHFRPQDGKPSIAIGVSVYPYHSKNAKELIEIADQAMYISKAQQIQYKVADYNPV
jgi:diguanylate cyclase (GGDEF)-like protein/PAS domain S-box-containing protein